MIDDYPHEYGLRSTASASRFDTTYGGSARQSYLSSKYGSSSSQMRPLVAPTSYVSSNYSQHRYTGSLARDYIPSDYSNRYLGTYRTPQTSSITARSISSDRNGTRYDTYTPSVYDAPYYRRVTAYDDDDGYTTSSTTTSSILNGARPYRTTRHSPPPPHSYTRRRFDEDLESSVPARPPRYRASYAVRASPSMPEVPNSTTDTRATPSTSTSFERQPSIRSASSNSSTSSGCASGSGDGSQRSKQQQQQPALAGGGRATTPEDDTLVEQFTTVKVTSSDNTTSGLRGLANIGNTCFMNSILQCLSHTKPLRDYCLSVRTYETDINNNCTSKMKGALMKAFCELMSQLWRDSRDSVTPTQFKSQIQKFAPRFTGYSQQDAQEFLRYLLQGLHDDVNRIRSKTIPATEIDDSLPDDKKAAETWKRYLRIDDSKIVDIFVGQLKSQLTCTHCGFTSSTFDPFWDLSLPIPRSTTGSVSIYDCFGALTCEETLDGEEKPTCEKCKCRRKCTKRFSIYKFPQILVLHLKRFSGERYRSRLSTHVNFPLTGMDLSRYATSANRSVFSLYGVANHTGTQLMGHYTAYTRHAITNKWLLCDDSRVSSVSDPARTVVSSDAYVLFFEMENEVSRL